MATDIPMGYREALVHIWHVDVGIRQTANQRMVSHDGIYTYSLINSALCNLLCFYAIEQTVIHKAHLYMCHLYVQEVTLTCYNNISLHTN